MKAMSGVNQEKINFTSAAHGMNKGQERQIKEGSHTQTQCGKLHIVYLKELKDQFCRCIKNAESSSSQGHTHLYQDISIVPVQEIMLDILGNNIKENIKSQQEIIIISGCVHLTKSKVQLCEFCNTIIYFLCQFSPYYTRNAVDYHLQLQLISKYSTMYSIYARYFTK